MIDATTGQVRKKLDRTERDDLWDVIYHQRVSSRQLASIAATLAVAIAIGGCFRAGLSSPLPTSGTQVPLPTTSAGPSATLSPSEGPSPSAMPLPTIAWTSAPMDGMPSAVGRFADGWVAVGSDGDGVASWTSNDGLGWVPGAVPFSDATGFQHAEMGSMAALDGRVYSVGFGNIGADTNMPLAWSSDDGLAWSEIPRTDPFFTDYGMVWGTEASKERLVALKNYGLHTGSIWSSEDAVGWADVSPGPVGISPPERGIMVLDVVYDGTRFVVVGESADGSAAAWVSTDGTEWTPAPASESLAGGSMRT